MAEEKCKSLYRPLILPQKVAHGLQRVQQVVWCGSRVKMYGFSRRSEAECMVIKWQRKNVNPHIDL